MTFPVDYVERVYAGVLGKIIGVYLGRPFEGWDYERIMAELGEIWYYVHEERGLPLVVTDDDISGTFTFIRALEDYGYRRDITPAQIGRTWLNYLIEGKTILSWAGLGCSTEHTAYLRLKHGIPAPRSGSIEMNGPIVAQQIGAQIFIDSWAMVAPGDPDYAADLAARAASVSHDGEAIYGAQLLAAMEAQAFIESDRFKLLETGLSLIPRDSHIFQMATDLREFHAKEKDWRKGREFIVNRYGYTAYLGGCHIVPNSALILLGLLYGNDDFQKSLMITNTSGWDTDCNSGNLGCLLGIKDSLVGIDSSPVDWRSPVADRLYLPTADGGRAITDAVQEAFSIANTGRCLVGQPILSPKAGASASGKCRFHFELPGSVQGFRADSEPGLGQVSLFNTVGHSRFGERSLGIRVENLLPDQMARIVTATFIPPESLYLPGYFLMASPTLYPGQTIRSYLEADPGNQHESSTTLYLNAYRPDGSRLFLKGPHTRITPGEQTMLTWRVPDTGGAPIYEIGLQLEMVGIIYLDALTWDGAPDFTFSSLPGNVAKVWRQAWINGVQHWEGWSEEPYRIVQDEGRGMLISGTREWQNYRLQADIRPAFLVKNGGIAVYVQGTQRFYGLFISGDGAVRLVKERDGQTIMAETPLKYEMWQTIGLRLDATGGSMENALAPQPVHLRAWLDGRLLFDLIDSNHPLDRGGVALIVEEGHLLAGQISVIPLIESE